MSGGGKRKIGPRSFLVNYGYFLHYFSFFSEMECSLKVDNLATKAHCLWRLYLDCFGSLWNFAVFVIMMCYAVSGHCFVRCRSMSTFSCEGEKGTEHVTSVVEGITHKAFYCCKKKRVSNVALGIASVDSAFCDHFFDFEMPYIVWLF